MFRVIDASDNWSRMATDITIASITQPDAMPIDTYAVLAHVVSTWNRSNAMDFTNVMIDYIVPPYRALMGSYEKAQKVQENDHETKLDMWK